MLRETGNLVVKVDVKENMKEGLMKANTELPEACVSSGKANSVSGKANGVIRVASGLPRLSWGYPSYLNALLDKISLSQGGRLMRKFQVRPVEGYPTG
jgi:hypothetical protein